MLPRDLVYVGHMLDMARKAVSKTQGISRESYDADENLRLALIHLIQTIGEAARQVSLDRFGWSYVAHDRAFSFVPWTDGLRLVPVFVGYFGAGGGNRTRTLLSEPRILSPVRLP